MSKVFKVLVLFGLTRALLFHAAQTRTTERALAEDNATVVSQTRTLKCIPILRLFNLELRQPLRSDEQVGITGSHERLGEWHVERSVDMQRRDESGLTWYLSITLCASERIYYRYFIYQRDARGNRRIRRWEGHQHARVMKSYAISRQLSADIFGEVYREWLLGVEQERGWLRCDYMLQLKFVWARHFRFDWRAIGINHMAAVKYSKYLLKLLVYQDGMNMTPQRAADTEIEVSRYVYNRSHFRPQRETGVPYTQGDILVYRIIKPLRTAKHRYQLTIYNTAGEPFGYVSIRPMHLRNTCGTLHLPIYSTKSGSEIGQLTLPYLIVQPLASRRVLTFRSSFHHYWPLNWPTLDVGHRGMGKSYYDSDSRYTENTIRSLLAAYRQHADMVELDVRVTRDYVSVLWHEVGFYTAPYGLIVQSAADLRYVLIEQLNYRRLKYMRVFVYKRGQWREYTRLNVRNVAVSERIFPTLEEVYEALPKTLGLLVEIKWPQLELYAVQRPQRQRTLDKNRYVDRLLEHAFSLGCGRPLIFTSLDADICTLLRHKQHLFAVLFVASGESALWQPYRDLRTSSFREAVNFAQSEDLMGTAAHAEDLLADGEQQLQHQVQLGLRLLQAVFVWGRDLNSARILRQFKQAQVSGLIYDRLAAHGLWKKRASFFNAPELLEIYARQCYRAEGNETFRGAAQANACAKRNHIKTRSSRGEKSSSDV